MCSAAACKNVLLLTDATPADPALATVIQQDAAKIGITFTVRPISGPYPILSTVRRRSRSRTSPGWRRVPTRFRCSSHGSTAGRSSRSGIPTIRSLGITPAQCRLLHVTGDCSPYDTRTGLGVPNVNGKIDRCGERVGGARRSCFERLDEYLMTRGRSRDPLPHARNSPRDRVSRQQVGVRRVRRHDLVFARRRLLGAAIDEGLRTLEDGERSDKWELEAVVEPPPSLSPPPNPRRRFGLRVTLHADSRPPVHLSPDVACRPVTRASYTR